MMLISDLILRECKHRRQRFGAKALSSVFTFNYSISIGYPKMCDNICYPQQNNTMSCAVKIRKNMLNG